MKENYIVKQTDENTWVIIDDENGEVVNTITKDDIVNYCKTNLEDDCIEGVGTDILINRIWFDIVDDYNLVFVDNYCQYWDKFTAWFDYVIAEYHSNEIIALYKERLLNWE